MPSPLTRNLIPSRVTMDAMEASYPCFLDRAEKWNGWACPFFTKEQAEKLLAVFAADEPGFTWAYYPGREAFGIETADYPGEEDVCHVTKHPTLGDLYPVGSWNWCWVEVSPPTIERLLLKGMTDPEAQERTGLSLNELATVGGGYTTQALLVVKWPDETSGWCVFNGTGYWASVGNSNELFTTEDDCLAWLKAQLR